MKTLLLAAAMAMTATTSFACSASDLDFNALAGSPSQLTPAKFTAMTPAQKKSVCDTRAFIKKVDAQGGVINGIDNYSTKYLTSDENGRINDATTQYVNGLLAAKGYATA